MAQNIFSAMELDAIGEMMNISLGSSATAVSNLLDHRVDITTPKVTVVPISEFTLGELEPAIGVEIKYVSGLEGSNIMLLKRSDVKAIVELLMGTEIPEEEFELNELTISAVCELMNQMMGAASTALSDFLGRPVNISTPQSFSLDDLEEIKRERFHSETGMLVAVHFILEIEGVLKSEFVNIMSVELARELLAGFGMGIQDTGEAEADATPAAQPAQPEPSSGAGGKLSQEEIERLMGGGVSTPAPEPAAAPSSCCFAWIHADKAMNLSSKGNCPSRFISSLCISPRCRSRGSLTASRSRCPISLRRNRWEPNRRKTWS